MHVVCVYVHVDVLCVIVMASSEITCLEFIWLK